MSVFLSIIIIVVLIALIYLMRFSISNLGGFNHEKLRWILAGYSVILLLALGIYYMLPTDQFMDQQTLLSEEDRVRTEHDFQSFYTAAQKGLLDEAKEAYPIGHWSFTYTGKTIDITDDRGHRGNYIIFAERDATLENEIRIYGYSSSTIMNGIDFTSEIKPPSISLKDDRIIITEPERYEVSFANFKKEYIIGQFLGSDNDIYRGNTVTFGSRVLFLKIPVELEFKDFEYIVFIN